MPVSSGDKGETRWLSQDEQRTWRAFLWGTRILEVALDRALHETGLSLSEYEILSMLSEADDHRLRMSELADLVLQSRSRLTHTAARLEKRGLVERIPHTKDRRGVVLCLSDEGYQMVLGASRVHVRSVRENLIDLVPEDQFHALGEVMRTVESVLRDRGLRP